MSRHRRMGWLALWALVVLLAGCGEREGLPAGVALEEQPEQESWGVNLLIELGGQPRAQVAAPYVARFERSDSTFARFGPAADTTGRVRVQVYDEGGQPSATVEADRLYYFDEERRFVAEGRVVVESVNERRLEGERLTWDEAARELTSDGFVRITTPTERIQGYRLVADETLETYRLARISGEVEVEDV